MPRGGNNTLPYCTSFFDGEKYFNSLKEFMDEMANPEIRDHCSKGCLPNCEETRYSFQMDKADLNLNELCYEEDTRNVQIRVSMNYIGVDSLILIYRWLYLSGRQLAMC